MAKDIYHATVRRALEKEGWHITHDPYTLKDYNPDWEIDLGAEKLIAAQRDHQKIAVEVESFLAESFAHEFHKVLGQYMNYMVGLEVTEPERILFVAVPLEIYERDFQRRGIKISIAKYQVRLLIFDPFSQTVVQWLQ